MDIVDIEYERLLHEDYITDIEICKVANILSEEESISQKSKKDMTDKRLNYKDNDYKTKLIDSIKHSPQYIEKTKDMNPKEVVIFDKEISKMVSSYFPSIKEFWIKNKCSENILTQYALASLNIAFSKTSIDKIRKHNLEESSFMDKFETFHKEDYDITRFPSIKLKPIKEHKKSLSEIISESAKINESKQIINEVNQESIRKTAESFLAMIKRMSMRFINYAKKQMNTSKNYLLTKKDEILSKKPGENIPIEMRNYGTGIKNILGSAIPPFESMRDSLPGDKIACENMVKQKIAPRYNDFNIDFKQWCIAFFEGGSQKVKTNINALNMNEIYSFVSTYDTRVIPTIQRDLNTIQQLANTSLKIGSDIASAHRQLEQQKSRAMQNKQTMQTVRRESYLMEAPQTPPPQTGAAPANGAPAGDKMVIGKQQGGVQNTNTPAMSSMQQQNQVKTANTDNMKMKIYKKIAIQYIGAKMTAASTIYKDYMTILKTHAPERGYAGNASTGLNIENPEAVLKQINLIQNIKDKNKQNQAIQELIASVQQNNPGFNGGLNDIATAANMALKKR